MTDEIQKKEIKFISNIEVERLESIYRNERLIINGFSCNINEVDRIKPKETDPQIKIRIPPFFKQIIDIESKKNGRSKTAEILHRLKMSFENNKSIEKEK